MPVHSKNDFQLTWRFLVAGLLLVALTVFTPMTIDGNGHSFFAVAANSTWGQFGDWGAAWCNFKMIVLAMSGMLLAIAAIEFCTALRRDRVASFGAALFVPPILLFFVGCYDLLKAVL